MREQGCCEEDLFSFLAQAREKDMPYERILSSMCTLPHPVAIRAHTQFMGTNLGDPGLFPGTAELERLLVHRLGSLLHHPGATGYATSGGTESNIQALRIARKMRAVDQPNVVIPESAHFSFDKACEMLGLEVRSAPLDSSYRMALESLDSLIDDHTICVVAVAGTTEYGMVDPVLEIAALAEERGIFCHVDAAFGGLVLPFLEEAPPFDFELSGVSSISVDPHKMGMSTIPTGCILVRDAEMLEQLNVCTPYLTVKQECTLMGTRSGGSVAGALAVLEYMGRRGMERVVRGCMENTSRLIRGMETFGFPPVVRPDVNVATFECPRAPRGWHLSRTRRGHMRIVCMPHVHRESIEIFLQEIGEMYA